MWHRSVIFAITVSANVAGGYGEVHDTSAVASSLGPLVGDGRAWADHFQLQHGGGHRSAQPVHAQDLASQHPELLGAVIFAAAAMCTVLCMGLAAERLRARGAEASLPALATCVCLPWFLATFWLLHVAIRSLFCELVHAERCGAVHPIHPPRCHWLAWYLILAPALTAPVAVFQVLALLTANTCGAEERPMGRMFQRRAAPQANPWSAIVAASARLPRKLPQEKAFELVVQRATWRYTLLVLEALAMASGASLIVFAADACEAGLWWAAASFTMATVVVLTVAATLLKFYVAADHPCEDEVKMQYGIVYASPPSSRECSRDNSPAAATRATTLSQLWKAQYP